MMSDLHIRDDDHVVTLLSIDGLFIVFLYLFMYILIQRLDDPLPCC